MRVAIAVVALWLALGSSAMADVFDDNPATASRGPGDAWVFARATSGEILERHLSGATWTPWASLGGNLASGPAAVGYGNAVLVFARGVDGAVYQDSLIDGKWSGWSSLGGVVTSAPAASVRRGPEGYVDLAAKGTDNAIFFRTYIPGTGWSPWASLGGNLSSAPSLNSQSAGIVNVWARGTDATLQQKAWDGRQWLGWGSLAGGMSAAPTVVSRAENVLDVFVRGGDNATYQRYWTLAGGWGNWLLLDPAPIDSGPAAGASDGTHEWLFARRGASIAQKAWTATGGWTGWTDFGPVAVPAPPAAAPPAPTPPPAQYGSVSLTTGVGCTPVDGRLRVDIAVRKPKGQAKARVAKIVFYTKGKGRTVRVDRKAPFIVRMKINRPAGSTGRVYARVYYRRSAEGKLHRKVVSRRYTVCR